MPDLRRLIADNLTRVRERVHAAAIAAGRDPASVRLLAVSKYVDAATAALLVEAGSNALAESYPQKLWEKAADPRLAGVEWHLVGRLQRNKVRRTLPLVALIHSVDSERLLTAIDEQAADLNLTARVLLEVNCSGDANKQGLAFDEARQLASTLDRFEHVRICGLMTMAAFGSDERTARANFASLRRLQQELASVTPPIAELSELSMGMSGDFEAAIAEGATIVRIGSSLFEGVI